MVPVGVAPANQYADTPSGIPDPTTAGPPWIQIGTEGGFMPAPVVVPQQPVGFNMNTGQFNFSIVNQHSLYLMPAERADVIVDFTGLSGQVSWADCDADGRFDFLLTGYFSGVGNRTELWRQAARPGEPAVLLSSRPDQAEGEPEAWWTSVKEAAAAACEAAG